MLEMLWRRDAGAEKSEGISIMQSDKTRQIYIVVSQSGSIISMILRCLTGAKYNHASISLSKELECMYSFGRVYTYFPFWGGFVTESAERGTFKRFKDTKVVVLRLTVAEESYEEIQMRIVEMLSDKKRYHYNYLGLVLAGIKICWKQEDHYYCSEFVKDLLDRVEIEDSEELSPIIHPMQFLDMPHAEVIYTGLLRDYAAA